MSAAGRPECDVYVDYPPTYYSRPGDLWWSDGLDHGAVPVSYQRHVTSNTNISCYPFNVFASNVSYFRIVGAGASQYDIRVIYPQCGATRYVAKLLRTEGTPESDSILGKIEPRQSIPLIALVYDNLNNTVSNVDVKLTVEVKQNSGGHNHDDSRRHTHHMGKLAPSGGSQGSVELNGKVLLGNTGTAGLRFVFTAPEVAGDHAIKVECQGSFSCKVTGPDQLWVGVEGLINIPPSGFWGFIGETTIHPTNHYLTAKALGKLMDLGRLYKQVYFPFAKPLQLNDASLERGGVFDIATDTRTEWWTPPHHEHRRGTVIDIQANGTATAIPQTYFTEFQELLRRRGMTWVPERLNESGGHYHVRLLGIAQ